MSASINAPGIRTSIVNLRTILKTSSILVAITVITAAGIFLALASQEDALLALPGVIAVAVTVHGLACFSALCYVIRREAISLSALGVTRPSWRLLHLLWQIPLIVAAAVGVQVAIAVMTLGNDSSAAGSVQSSMTGAGTVAIITTVVAISLLTPIWEELYFRGLLQLHLSGRWSVMVGVIGSAVLFAALHGYVVLIPYYLTLGLALSSLRVFHRGLWGPLILHVTVNSVAASALLTTIA